MYTLVGFIYGVRDVQVKQYFCSKIIIFMSDVNGLD